MIFLQFLEDYTEVKIPLCSFYFAKQQVLFLGIFNYAMCDYCCRCSQYWGFCEREGVGQRGVFYCLDLHVPGGRLLLPHFSMCTLGLLEDPRHYHLLILSPHWKSCLILIIMSLSCGLDCGIACKIIWEFIMLENITVVFNT